MMMEVFRDLKHLLLSRLCVQILVNLELALGHPMSHLWQMKPTRITKADLGIKEIM